MSKAIYIAAPTAVQTPSELEKEHFKDVASGFKRHSVYILHHKMWQGFRLLDFTTKI
jgi:hypothetical protein